MIKRAFRYKTPEGRLYKIKPTQKAILEMGMERTMYFFYVKNYREQGLHLPYVQLVLKGGKVIADYYYGNDEMKQLFEFFTAVHEDRKRRNRG